MKSRLSLIILVFASILMSCNKQDDEPAYDAVLYADYTNPVGGQPSLLVDPTNSSTFINIEIDPTITEQNGRIMFNYSAVTFKEGNKVYRIDDIVTERNNIGNWLADDENTLSWTFSKSLDIVLVLDVSSSLGENITTIKDNAQLMLSNILDQNPDARISVVKFSRGNASIGFTSSKDELGQFISQNSSFDSPDIGIYELEGRQETALYEAIDKAIELLTDSDARGKGILTFTDGVSNFQFETEFQNPTSVIAQLTTLGIANYTVGYEGNQGSVDKDVLKSLAVNGDFSFPDNLTALNTVFERFSNNVAAVYDLIYDTNNAKFDGTNEFRFLFNTTLISEN